MEGSGLAARPSPPWQLSLRSNIGLVPCPPVLEGIGRLPGLARARWRGEPFLRSLVALRSVAPWWELPRLAWRFGRVQLGVPCPHSIEELGTVARAITARTEVRGAVVECGCFKGGSTARLSLVCALAKRKLVVFDSFEGLPEPEPWDAEHRIGRLRQFRRGEYRGAIEEVRANLAAFGRIDVCELVPGWLGSVPHERVPDAIAVAFIDVDLVTSTAAALDLVWPRVAPGGIVFVHDAADAKLTGFLGEWAATVHPRRTSGPAAFAWFEK